MLTSQSKMSLARVRGKFENDDLTADSNRTCGTGSGAQNGFGTGSGYVRQHQGGFPYTAIYVEREGEKEGEREIIHMYKLI